jgi:hypothetical protein
VAVVKFKAAGQGFSLFEWNDGKQGVAREGGGSVRRWVCDACGDPPARPRRRVCGGCGSPCGVNVLLSLTFCSFQILRSFPWVHDKKVGLQAAAAQKSSKRPEI